MKKENRTEGKMEDATFSFKLQSLRGNLLKTIKQNEISVRLWNWKKNDETTQFVTKKIGKPADESVEPKSIKKAHQRNT